MVQAPRLETPRLVLTWPRADQIPGYYDAIVDTDMFDTIIWEGPTAPSDLFAHWAERRAHGAPDCHESLDLAVIERESDRYIGGVSLRPDEGCEVANVGYAFAPEFQRRGYGTEALGALVDHGFKSRGAERIYATIFLGNTPSRRVVEKLGFSYEGTLRRAVKKRDAWLDEWLLAMTRPDWVARQLADSA